MGDELVTDLKTDVINKAHSGKLNLEKVRNVVNKIKEVGAKVDSTLKKP